MSNSNSKEISLYLQQVLSEYEIIPANFGWHIHKGDEYCGHLAYQDKQGWQGSALNHLPIQLVEQLKNFILSTYFSTNNFNFA